MDAPQPSQDGIPHASDPRPRLPRRPARTVSFMNQKGGVGKTTTTVNLGAAFARLGRRCLLIDLDPQAHCTLHLGIEQDEDSPTIYDLLLDPDRSVLEVICRGRDNLDIIPAETSLAAAEVELTTQPGREMILREKIAPLIDQYDYILFDCPPSLGLLTLNALVASREVIIPMQAHFLPLQGVGKLLETIALVRQRLNRDLTVTGIVLCSHDGHTTLAREIVADLREFFGSTAPDTAWQDCAIFEPPVRRNVKLAEAPSFGRTIFEYAAWCAGAQDYAALGENLLIHWEGSAEPREMDQSQAMHSARFAQPPAPTSDEAADAVEHAPPYLVEPKSAGDADDGSDMQSSHISPDSAAPHDSSRASSERLSETASAEDANQRGTSHPSSDSGRDQAQDREVPVVYTPGRLSTPAESLRLYGPASRPSSTVL